MPTRTIQLKRIVYRTGNRPEFRQRPMEDLVNAIFDSAASIGGRHYPVGPTMRMTAHHVEARGRLPRDAVIRKVMAAPNGDLFSGLTEQAPLALGYAQIVHSGRQRPDSTTLVIPSADHKYPVYAEPLFAEISSRAAPVENIPEELEFRIARGLEANEHESDESDSP